MSMLSTEIDKLRDRALLFEGYQNGEISSLLREVSDTIESLRDRLQAENSRAERTCTIGGRFNSCSACGASIERVTHSVYEMGDGFACSPSYCPNCGAKVVD